jgi:hypothetical protein
VSENELFFNGLCWAMLDNQIRFEGDGHMPAQKISVTTTKPIISTLPEYLLLNNRQPT